MNECECETCRVCLRNHHTYVDYVLEAIEGDYLYDRKTKIIIQINR